MLCDECPHRSVCSSLCPEAELYAGQDKVSQREKPIGLPRYGRMPMPKREIKFTKKEEEIVRFLAKGTSKKKICETLEITSGYYDVLWSRLKKKMRQNV